MSFVPKFLEANAPTSLRKIRKAFPLPNKEYFIPTRQLNKRLGDYVKLAPTV